MSLSHPVVQNLRVLPSTPLQTLPALPTLQSSELFKAGREILIEHAQEYYRLRLTRKGKLILTK
ncbi:hemin uptake protein HemP [Oceanibaculum pacificum]|uniref:Hemin uptake protein HemP n=1 Tax=Oceanibaculum pacificum TaxID=580166 RepID=A0A154VYI3_9PROT|nr:hemin uptake protein HemP [Oceanibaculum pacificum]KZD06402.1 hypothetical protein AUP43_10790 [Oceanibaculum pacificum]